MGIRVQGLSYDKVSVIWLFPRTVILVTDDPFILATQGSGFVWERVASVTWSTRVNPVDNLQPSVERRNRVVTGIRRVEVSRRDSQRIADPRACGARSVILVFWGHDRFPVAKPL